MPVPSRIRLAAALAGLIAATLTAAAPDRLAAQEAASTDAPVSLIADQVRVDREGETLTAEGNVAVLYDGRTLHARRIVYERKSDRVRVEGPLTITDPEGEILLADSAELSPDLENGLIQGARLLIDGQFQVAAAEVRRGGRFTTFHRTVASSCTICAGNPTPTWAIRAARVTADTEARRIYFEDASLEIFGLPFGYLPRLSIPDPQVRRASGVLQPVFQQSEIYGFGVKLPYYRVLGPNRDATITPFFTTGGAAILEGQYRQRQRTGGFDLDGILAVEDGLDDQTPRGFLSAVGAYSLGRGFIGDFDLNVASDRTFLQQFDYSDEDLLTSTARITRTRDRDYLELGTIAFQSLREGEDSGTIPFILPDLRYRRLLTPPLLGGRAAFDVDALGILRGDGSDMLRGGGGVDWLRSWRLPSGLLAEATGAVAFDVYRAWDDPNPGDETIARVTPLVSSEFRWPLMRTSGRASEVLEPTLQLLWSDALGSTPPNEDSQLPEFDETNLFAASRFPGRDRTETGLRANIGVSYTRYDPTGWQLGFTLGRVLRAEPLEDMPAGTGLTGRMSDYVGAVDFGLGDWLQVANRSLFDDDFGFLRNEFGLKVTTDKGALASTYVYLAEDDSNPILGPQPQTSEVRFDARYRVHPNWEIRGFWRYDLVADAPLRAGGSVLYGNDCAELDLSIARRYTSSENLPPATSMSFNVTLIGLGNDTTGQNWPRRICRPG